MPLPSPSVQLLLPLLWSPEREREREREREGVCVCVSVVTLTVLRPPSTQLAQLISLRQEGRGCAYPLLGQLAALRFRQRHGACGAVHTVEGAHAVH
jgi:hypothetical protein